jgi:serine/threonine protein kinase
MVLEYCSRGTLTDAISRGAFCLPAAAGGGAPGLPDVACVVRVARDVASAMAYLHGQVRGDPGPGRQPPRPAPEPRARALSLLPFLVPRLHPGAPAPPFVQACPTRRTPHPYPCPPSSHPPSLTPLPTPQNVLHGDLNGNNILLVPPTPADGEAADPNATVAKVADFGLSRLLPIDSDRIVTRTHGGESAGQRGLRRGGGAIVAAGAAPARRFGRCLLCRPPKHAAYLPAAWRGFL